MRLPGGDRGREVFADHVVVATLMPFLDRGAFSRARHFPSRSYVISARIAEPARTEIFITVGSPTRSLRHMLMGATSCCSSEGRPRGIR